MQQYFHLTGVLGRWLYAARRLALLERATGSKPPRRWLYLAVFRNRRAIRKAVKTNLVKNFHETKEIKFNVISIHILYGLQKQMIYKSPTYNRQQSSSYYIGVIDGELAYIRKSNHWGKFTTNIYEWDNAVGFEGISGDFYGRVGYYYYNWELKGGERTKQGVYKHTSQAGYVFIRDIQNGKFNCATLAGRS